VPTSKDLDQFVKLAHKKAKEHLIHEAREICEDILSDFPHNKKIKNLLKKLKSEDFIKKLDPSTDQLQSLNITTHYNSGIKALHKGKLKEAEQNFRRVIELSPNHADAHNNLGVTLYKLGKLEEAEISYTQALKTKPNNSQIYNNLGITQQELSKIDQAKLTYEKALALNPENSSVFWNLSSLANSIADAEQCLSNCLTVDKNHQWALLTKAALKYYRGEKTAFNDLKLSKFRNHPYMRSFSWAFSLPSLPELYFNRWSFFDAIIKKSVRSRPFYEFGVFTGISFNYLIKFFKKGYGFDTFTGIPESWNTGKAIENAGSYSSFGEVPNIERGEFIVGEFDDSLPVFFSEDRPLASLLNFDADLYSSTITALNFSKSVIDENTILIFDEFIMHESWENDEYKALNDFCVKNNLRYKVLAISFMTKQVAVQLKSATA